MKRIIFRCGLALLLIALFVVPLAGCRRLVEPEEKPMTIYATFWPIYALTDAAMKDVPDARLRLLVQPQDGCLRDYELSDWDAAILSGGADAVIMGGRGLERFESALFGWGESGPAISAVLYNLELYSRQERAGGDQESHLEGANPHLYMSLDGAQRVIESISATLQSLDPGYAARYAQNAQDAEARLKALLSENRALLADCEGKGVILMNEALIYPALDYGLTVSDWVDRESGDALVDNELKALIERLNACDARVILIERQAPQALTEALSAAGYAVARLDVMSNHREGEGFEEYIEIQSANARAISEAFAAAETLEAGH